MHPPDPVRAAGKRCVEKISHVYVLNSLILVNKIIFHGAKYCKEVPFENKLGRGVVREQGGSWDLERCKIPEKKIIKLEVLAAHERRKWKSHTQVCQEKNIFRKADYRYIYRLAREDGMRKGAWYPETFCFGVLGNKKISRDLDASHSLAHQTVNSTKAENMVACTAEP